MIGEKLTIQTTHKVAAKSIYKILLPKIIKSNNRYVISIAGESGCGKTVTAMALKNVLDKHNLLTKILQQDDYFIRPPATNAQYRQQNINRVGIEEIRLDTLNKHIFAAVNGVNKIRKPLIVYERDLIQIEILNLRGTKVVIVEGTYTSILEKIDSKIFIDMSFKDTKQYRLVRNREIQDNFLESILEIEHKIISSHKVFANIIITNDFKVFEVKIIKK